MKRVLHVGCGFKNPETLHEIFRTPEWEEVRLDIDPRVAPDIVGNIVNMSMVPMSSYDAVWSSHNLEHLESHEVPLALSEFYRVLKPTGFLLVFLPDLQNAAEYVAQGKLLEPIYNSSAGPIAPIDIIFGFRPSLMKGDRFMAHRTGFTAESLGQAIMQAGFLTVKVERSQGYLWATAFIREL